jgi:hypothetical protein
MNTPAQVTAGKNMYAELQSMLAARNAISEALAGRDLAAIQSALAKATAAKVEDTEVVASAQALIATLEKEKEAVAALVAACDARTLTALESALATATGLGLTEESTPEVATASTLKNSLIAEQACKGALTKATAAKDSDALSKGLAEAQQLGLSGAEVRVLQCSWVRVSFFPGPCDLVLWYVFF